VSGVAPSCLAVNSVHWRILTNGKTKVKGEQPIVGWAVMVDSGSAHREPCASGRGHGIAFSEFRRLVALYGVCPVVGPRSPASDSGLVVVRRLQGKYGGGGE
jgi:hypothetical protein